MKSKTMAVIGMLLWCLYVPAAHSADATFNVNGKAISCTVTDIEIDTGEWWKFNLKYEFCNGNRVTYRCIALTRAAFIPGRDVHCSSGPEPKIQDCNEARYTFVNEYSKKFDLYANTQNAQKYVCEQQFNRMTVTVTPLM